MREGKLGEVKLAKSIIYSGRGSIGGPAECVMPPRCDYDLWAGPAPMTKLTRPKFHYDWHWFWDTGNGEIGNNNVHSLDICRWGLGVTGLGRSVLSYGGRLGYTDVAETPNSQVGIFDFGDKTIVSETRGLKTAPFHPTIKSMWFFYGSEGIIADTSLFDPKGNLVRAFEGQIGEPLRQLPPRRAQSQGTPTSPPTSRKAIKAPRSATSRTSRIASASRPR
jgi:predicted dehydrogenase